MQLQLFTTRPIEKEVVATALLLELYSLCIWVKTLLFRRLRE